MHINIIAMMIPTSFPTHIISAFTLQQGSLLRFYPRLLRAKSLILVHCNILMHYKYSDPLQIFWIANILIHCRYFDVLQIFGSIANDLINCKYSDALHIFWCIAHILLHYKHFDVYILDVHMHYKYSGTSTTPVIAINISEREIFGSIANTILRPAHLGHKLLHVFTFLRLFAYER